MLVDSHCHLNYKGLAEQQSEILARARDTGVTAMLNIATRESEWDDVLGTAAAFWIIQGCYKIGAGRCVQAAGDDGPRGEQV